MIISYSRFKSLKLFPSMDRHQLLSYPFLFSFLLFVFMIFRVRKKSKKNVNAIPGPLKLPLIGNLHLLLGCLPHHRLRDLATKYGPLMHLKFGEVSHIIISSPETAREILKNYDISFAQRPPLFAAKIVLYNFADIAFAPYGDSWRELRKICTLKLLSAKQVQSYRSIREEEVSNLIRSISSSAGLPVNFTSMIFSLSNDITARAAFGERCKDREAFIRIITKLSGLAGGFTLVDAFPSIKSLQLLSGMKSVLEKFHQEEDKIVGNIINEHRAMRAAGTTAKTEADTLVNVLLDIQEHGNLKFPLTNENIKAVIKEMFTGGSETSATIIEWTMSEMLKNPRVLEKAQAEVREVFDRKGNVDETGLHELQYLKLVIKEVLRLHPPLPLLLPRECRESSKILGYDIPVGTKVLVNAWAIGRDPRYWTEAETFYPERFLDSSVDYTGNHFEFIPFGAGRRMCPGISFGMANVDLPLATLLYHFDWKLADGTENKDLDMNEHFGAVIRRKKDLRLIPVPSRPLNF